MTAADGEAAAARRDHAGPPWDAPGQQVPLEAGNPITNLNELFAFIALEEPGGFAGVHVEDDRFVIQMVEPGRARAGAMRWIRHFFGDQIRGMPVEFRRTDRSFADLMSWYGTFRKVVFGHGGAWTDVAEAENRLEAGITPGRDQQSVRERLLAAGVPGDLFALRTADPVNVAGAHLDDEFRPVVGGVNVDCTVGFNARHWEDGRGFVTAAHCTGEAGQLNETEFSQLNPGVAVGTEVIDPPFLTSLDGCTFSGGCRYSDAAFVEYNSNVADSLGYLARPECRNCESIVIDIAGPHFQLIDEYHGLTDGLTVYYVGHQTGWETGSIIQTCVDYELDNLIDHSDYPDGSGLLCQFKVDNGDGAITPDKGDSGSPVVATFSSSEEVNTRLAGVVWATTVDNDDGHWWFSPITGIRDDLDPNTSLSCDGLETVAGGGCDGPDGDFSDCTGDRESFQCESDGGF